MKNFGSLRRKRRLRRGFRGAETRGAGTDVRRDRRYGRRLVRDRERRVRLRDRLLRMRR